MSWSIISSIQTWIDVRFGCVWRWWYIRANWGRRQRGWYWGTSWTSFTRFFVFVSFDCIIFFFKLFLFCCVPYSYLVTIVALLYRRCCIDGGRSYFFCRVCGTFRRGRMLTWIIASVKPRRGMTKLWRRELRREEERIYVKFNESRRNYEYLLKASRLTVSWDSIFSHIKIK